MNNINKTVFCLIIICLVSINQTQATYQGKDNVIYRGRNYEASCCSVFDELLILEKYSIGDVLGSNKIFSTGCLKGYMLELKIKKNRVYISKVEDCNECQIDLEKHFPNRIKKGKIFADWYSGMITLNYGTTARGDLFLFYSNEIRLLIKNGVVVGKYEIEYKKDELNDTNFYVNNNTFSFLNKSCFSLFEDDSIVYNNGFEESCLFNSEDRIFQLKIMTAKVDNEIERELVKKFIVNPQIIHNGKFTIYQSSEIIGDKRRETNLVFHKNSYALLVFEFFDSNQNVNMKNEILNSFELIEYK